MPRVIPILLALACATSGCARPAEPAAQVTATPAPAATPASLGALDWCRAVPLEGSFCRALVVDGPRGTLRLALADTGRRRERGLMGVVAIPPGEGMLFVFPYSSDRHLEFWMKNTLVSLDMVWVLGDGTISKIASSVPATKPGTADAAIARRSGVGSYVIELRAGGASAAGLQVGKRITLPPVEAR